MNSLLLSILAIPFIFGLFSFFVPERYKKTISFLALAVSLFALAIAVAIFRNCPININIGGVDYFLVDRLSAFITMFIGLFGFLIALYSLGFMKDCVNLNKYYAYILWTISAAIGVVLSNHLVLFLAFWGVLGITLYLLMAMGREGSEASAKKTFIIIGGSDTLLLLGIAIIWKLVPTLEISKIHIPLSGSLAVFSFVCLALAAFAKAGVMPLHTWIPDLAETAPTPVMAFLPASLDKLLGIYLLFRVSVNIFDEVQPNSAVSLFLIIAGCITIIVAGMMAFVQHNFKKLLSYYIVSQAGYIILAIGTANPVGIAGGLFHMLNNAIYKSCLFLSGGNVEYRTDTDDLTKLGGLAKFMPVTFFTFLIAAFSISGIPPFNGFVSKWMIYQGIIELGKFGDKLWPLWLCIAMFGSTLTIASFMKLIHAIFLGQKSSTNIRKVKEVPLIMNIAPMMLALLCIIFGVFFISIPLRFFILPSMDKPVLFNGTWNSSLAAVFIFIGLFIGLIVYLLGNLKIRQVNTFIGGEDLEENPEMKPSGVEFYNTITKMPLLSFLYRKTRIRKG